MRRTRTRRLDGLAAALLAAAILVLWPPAPATAQSARPAPPLPPPDGPVVRVGSEPELQAAVRSLRSGVTIVVAPGVYRLTRSLYLGGPLHNVAIRGATTDADDVVLLGRGMAQPAYGQVPHGIWTGDGVDGITVANLTLKDFYFHPIIFNGGTDRPHVYNVRLIDAGQQFIKSNPDAVGVGASRGVVEYSVFEYTTTARDDYPKGIDVHGGAGWVIRHNLFRNLMAPPGQLMGPAVLVWRGSRDTLTEGNTFINCARGIIYGAEEAAGTSHARGIIRNNLFYRGRSSAGDVGIHVADSPGTHVLHNTVFVSGTYPTPIEYRFVGATGLLLANNLLDGRVGRRDDASGAEVNNVTADASMFVNVSAGDLRLAATAAAAIDRGRFVGVRDDWEGDVRPVGGGYDVGADERVHGTGDGRTGRSQKVFIKSGASRPRLRGDQPAGLRDGPGTLRSRPEARCRDGGAAWSCLASVLQRFPTDRPSMRRAPSP